MPYSKELELAKSVALAVGKLQCEYLEKTIRIEIKDDQSPVTEIDEKSEAIIREAIGKAFPDDGILGEEGGTSEGPSGRMWVVDPIDGTRPYIKGMPTFSVLIGLQDKGEMVMGVIHLPALGETYWAIKGQGAFCNGKQVHVSTETDIKKAAGSAIGYTQLGDQKDGQALYKLIQDYDYHFGFADAYSYACVIKGQLDLCISLLDKPWDRSPAMCIVREAGGKFSNLNGKEELDGYGTVLSNGHLHGKILAYFQ